VREFYAEVINRIVEDTVSVEISGDESQILNSFPSEEVISILRQLFSEADDPIHKSQLLYKSRVFRSLLSIRVFDKVEFLIETLETSSEGWPEACCRNLATFKDPRAIEKLCQVVRESGNSDLRFTAVKALSTNGDASALETLKSAVLNDKGADFEGFPISEAAEKAIQEITSRLGPSSL
jgi:HEAT repeat protein